MYQSVWCYITEDSISIDVGMRNSDLAVGKDSVYAIISQPLSDCSLCGMAIHLEFVSFTGDKFGVERCLFIESLQHMCLAVCILSVHLTTTVG